MRIFTLMEDTACAPDFACEHGLSFSIETNGRKLLFDMGQTDLFLKTLRRSASTCPRWTWPLSRMGITTMAAD